MLVCHLSPPRCPSQSVEPSCPARKHGVPAFRRSLVTMQRGKHVTTSLPPAVSPLYHLLTSISPGQFAPLSFGRRFLRARRSWPQHIRLLAPQKPSPKPAELICFRPHDPAVIHAIDPCRIDKEIRFGDEPVSQRLSIHEVSRRDKCRRQITQSLRI